MGETVRYEQRVASDHGCPYADMRFDRFSGCDYYCATCGARHYEACAKAARFIPPEGTRDLDVEFV